MIRVNKQLNIALSPLSLSPCNHKEITQAKAKKRPSVKGKTATDEPISNEKVKPEKRLLMVNQTSIEDLNANNIALNSSVNAIANEKSPRSPLYDKEASDTSSDDQDGFIYEDIAQA